MNLGDVETKGYAVVPAYLTAPEIASLVREFAPLEAGGRRNPNFNTRFLPSAKLAPFEAKLVATARAASSSAEPMDRLRSGIFYATRIAWQWDWHTDTSSHYIHPHYLNFWIPLVKPDRARSGLCIVGFDALEARDPDLARELRGGGSTRVVIRDNKTIFQDTARRRIIVRDNPNLMEELAVTPELGPGDLLLVRHDVFHRTQDSDTQRLAISFRVNSSAEIASHAALADMGASKFNNMARMSTSFTKRFAAFEIAGKTELAGAEYDAIYDDLAARERDHDAR